MNRRQYLTQTAGAVAAVAVSGCSTDSGNGSNDSGSDASEGQTESGDVFSLASHDIEHGPMQDYELTITVENISDQELTSIRIDVAAFEGDTRLDTGLGRIYDLPSGISDSDTAWLANFSPDDVTRYTISIEVQLEDRTEPDPLEREYDGDDFRERLRGE